MGRSSGGGRRKRAVESAANDGTRAQTSLHYNATYAVASRWSERATEATNTRSTSRALAVADPDPRRRLGVGPRGFPHARPHSPTCCSNGILQTFICRGGQTRAERTCFMNETRFSLGNRRSGSGRARPPVVPGVARTLGQGASLAERLFRDNRHLRTAGRGTRCYAASTWSTSKTRNGRRLVETSISDDPQRYSPLSTLPSPSGQ